LLFKHYPKIGWWTDVFGAHLGHGGNRCGLRSGRELDRCSGRTL
jgi:hypothetical protein